jgi:hypothetical protein
VGVAFTRFASRNGVSIDSVRLGVPPPDPRQR